MMYSNGLNDFDLVPMVVYWSDDDECKHIHRAVMCRYQYILLSQKEHVTIIGLKECT